MNWGRGKYVLKEGPCANQCSCCIGEYEFVDSSFSCKCVTMKVFLGYFSTNCGYGKNSFVILSKTKERAAEQFVC